MADNDRTRRLGGLKSNLALPGESNRRNVQGGVGQVQDQASPIVSEKALEQPVVKPRGLRGRTTVRREAPVKTAGITGTEMLRLGPRGQQDIFPRVAKKVEPRQIDTSVLTEKGGVSTLRGTKPPATEQPDFTRGKRLGGARKKKSFNILNFEGIENIFSSAGELAAHFASPGFQAQQRKARGVVAGRKGRIAELKSIDSSIKALSGALADVELSEDEELKSTLSTQLSEAVSQRRNVATGAGGAGRGLDMTTPEGFVTFLAGKNIPKEERLSLTRRLFADGP